MCRTCGDDVCGGCKELLVSQKAIAGTLDKRAVELFLREPDETKPSKLELLERLGEINHDRLTEKEKKAIYFVYIKGASQTQAGRALGVSQQRIGALCKSAIEKIRTELGL